MFMLVYFRFSCQKPKIVVFAVQDLKHNTMENAFLKLFWSETTESFESKTGWSALQCFHIVLYHKSKMAIITRQCLTHNPVWH